MNEAETRAELIDPKPKESGWGVVDGSKILREHQITAGKIQTGGGRAKPLIADYVLVYQGRKLADGEMRNEGQRPFKEGLFRSRDKRRGPGTEELIFIIKCSESVSLFPCLVCFQSPSPIRVPLPNVLQ